MSTSSMQTPSVAAWFEANADKSDLQVLTALCDVISAAADTARCEIKWNAPSYAITEHFATTGFQPKGGVRLVLHRGAAKQAETLNLRDKIRDPSNLLEWKEPDRAMVVFATVADVEAARPQLSSIVREWAALTQ